MKHSLESLSNSKNLDMSGNPEGVREPDKQKDPWDMSDYIGKMGKLNELIDSLPKKQEDVSEGYEITEWEEPQDSYEGIDESEPDIDGVPQTIWRGERLYLDNIDELGRRNITTKNHEAKQNRDGQTFLSRDKKYASSYAIGKDGVVWYDGPLPKEQIPIGIVYKINNADNHLGVKPSSDEPEYIGPFTGKFREFMTETPVTPEDYSVEEIYIMDDFLQPDGHRRSDFRTPMEVYKISDQSKIGEVIEKVKQRMSELDEQRQERI